MKIANTIERGGSFGETSLQLNIKRAATVVCKEDCHFGILDKNNYDLKEVATIIRFLNKIMIS